MHRSILNKLFVLAILGTVSLLLLACSSQVPVSTAVGGAQVSGESSQVLEEAPAAQVQPEIVSEEPAVDTAAVDSQPAETSEASASEVIVNVISEPSKGESAPTEQGVEQNSKQISAAQTGAESTGIVVSGSGQASSAPDLATLRLGVQAIELTVGEARNTAATAMTAVFDSVTEAGVEEKDIQTGYFSIQPRYTGREITRCVDAEGNATEAGEAMAEKEIDGSIEPGITVLPKAQECFQEYRSVITGYEVSNNLTVLVRDLESVDDVIDEAVDAGGDNIRFNGLDFSLEDTTALQSEARAAAVANLEDKAAELAELVGVQLGDLIYLSESGGTPSPVFKAEFGRAPAAFAADSRASTPISPGEVAVSVGVVGQYQISTGE